MQKIHQVSPTNAKRHLIAIGYFFYDKISVSMQAPLPPSLTAYMEDAGGLLLMAYKGPTAIACLSMKAHNKKEAMIDSISFALEADKLLAQEMIEEAMKKAKAMGYQYLQAKSRSVSLFNAKEMGFVPSAAHDRYLSCDLSQASLLAN